MMSVQTRFHRARADEGLGLVELIVAMSLLAIVLTLVVSLVANVSRTFTREASATDSANVASLALKELSRVIRAGTEIDKQDVVLNQPVFAYADANAMTLYSFLDTSATSPAPVKVSFAVDASSRELLEKRWTIVKGGGGSYWDIVSTPVLQWDRTIARKSLAPGTVLADGTTVPNLFTYLDKDSVVIPVPTSGGLSETDRARVAAVRVTIVIQADPTNRAAPVAMENTVGIPNLGISRVGPPPT